MTKPKNKSPAFQFYPKDFLTDLGVVMMSYETRGVYITLLCHDWLEDGIPTETFDAMVKDLDGSAIRQLMAKFSSHPTKEDFVSNSRLQKERSAQQERSSERAESGKKGALSKWNKDLGAVAKPPKEDGSATHQPMAKDGSSSSSSTSTAIISLSKERDTQTAKKPSWPPAGTEVAPLVFLTEDQKAYLKKNFSDREILYWLKELATSAGHNPTLWKKKYKNHMSVITSWRKRKLEDGYTWNENRRLYEKQGYRKQEPVAGRPNLSTFKPIETQKAKPIEDVKSAVATSLALVK
jgi:hypothetical protein